MTHSHIENSPDQRMHDIRAPVQRVEHNDHGSKTLATIALVIASVLLGGFVIYLVMSQQALAREESLRQQNRALEQQAAQAEIRAGAAEAEAVSHRARVDSRVALDEVERMRTGLASRGINIPKQEH